MANLCGPGDAQAMYGRLVAGSHETVQWDRNVTTIIFPEAAYLCLSADEAKEQNSRETSFPPRYLFFFPRLLSCGFGRIRTSIIFKTPHVDMTPSQRYSHHKKNR